MIERYLVKTFDEAFSRWRESWTAPPAHVAEWLHRFYRDLHPSTSIKKVLWENTPVMTRRNRCFTSTQHSLSSVLASMSSNRHGEKKRRNIPSVKRLRLNVPINRDGILAKYSAMSTHLIAKPRDFFSPKQFAIHEILLWMSVTRLERAKDH